MLRFVAKIQNKSTQSRKDLFWAMALKGEGVAAVEEVGGEIFIHAQEAGKNRKLGTAGNPHTLVMHFLQHGSTSYNFHIPPNWRPHVQMHKPMEDIFLT